MAYGNVAEAGHDGGGADLETIKDPDRMQPSKEGRPCGDVNHVDIVHMIDRDGQVAGRGKEPTARHGGRPGCDARDRDQVSARGCLSKQSELDLKRRILVARLQLQSSEDGTGWKANPTQPAAAESSTTRAIAHEQVVVARAEVPTQIPRVDGVRGGTRNAKGPWISFSGWSFSGATLRYSLGPDSPRKPDRDYGHQ